MKKLLLSLLFLLHAALFAFQQEEILEPEKAFIISAVQDADAVTTTIKLGDGIYIYDEMLKYTVTAPKELSLDPLITKPKPENFHDFIVHRVKDVVVSIPLSLIKEKVGEGAFTLRIDLQGCSEKGLCYQPQTKSFEFNTAGTSETKSAETKPAWKASGAAEKTPEASSTQATSSTPAPADALPVASAPVSEEDQIVNALKSGSVFKILALFFGFGLLLALTPCIFPMIPILSSIIVSHSGANKAAMSAGRGFFLSLVYVLSMSVAYTIAGILAGVFGANIQTAMQNPWVISVFAMIFVALALSMFGYYEIQLPSSLQSKITKTSDDAKGSGGLIGVAVMGFLSSLIVGPCVAPALAGALVYIGQTGDALLGGAALFAMSIGMGIPLLIVGAGAGKFMPRPGGWMTLVSQIFGVVMLGIAIWMLSRIIPPSIALFLWAVLFIGSGIYSGAFESFKEGASGAIKLIKVFAIMLVMIGAIMLVGSFSGATNPLNPLEKFGACTPIGTQISVAPQFQKVANVTELDHEISNSTRPVLIDFGADWCVACKEFEEITFKDAEVVKFMSEFTLLKVDVTKNSDADKELLKKYQVFGPPAIIFYDANKNELGNFKTIGYKPPEAFIQTLKSVLGR